MDIFVYCIGMCICAMVGIAIGGKASQIRCRNDYLLERNLHNLTREQLRLQTQEVRRLMAYASGLKVKE